MIFVNVYLNDVLLIDRDFCLLCPVRFYDDINVLYIEPSDRVFEDYSHMVSTSEFNEGIAEQSLELNVRIQLYSMTTGYETEYKQRFTLVREIINNQDGFDLSEKNLDEPDLKSEKDSIIDEDYLLA